MIRKIWGYGVTLTIAAVAGWIVWGEYQHYVEDRWTRDGQVRANVVGIAPRVSGAIIRIAVIDNQRVKRGDLSIKATIAALEAGFRQLDSAERYRNEKEVGEAVQENFDISTLPEDAMKEISEGIKTRQRFNTVVETGVPGFIPRGR